MPQFILIDHSLSGPGSHHYEYAVHILRAADQLGLDTGLACHRRFRDSTGLLHHSRVIPQFRYSTYGGNTLARPNHQDSPTTDYAFGKRWYHQWQQRRRARRQHKRLQAFRSACAQLLAEMPLSAGDHVFVPTMSEFDLLALSETLRNDPATRAAEWHLQFHFDFLSGRPSDYSNQLDRLAQMRERFNQALAGLDEHRLHFYSTTREMADQYNRLELVPFQVLDYPVNGSLRPPALSAAEHRPLRAVCGGRFRDEKGRNQLAQLVEDLWPDLLSSGEIQLLVQGPPSQLKRLLKRKITPCSQQQLSRGELPAAPLVQIPFPLPQDAYAQLVQLADLGLFLYDSFRYYARCSGVLVEMLACGTPVIVPAGCWLAEEITEPNQTYLAWLRSRLPLLDAPQNFELRPPAGAHRNTQSFPIPDGARVVSIQTKGAPSGAADDYLDWEIVQVDKLGRRICLSHQVHKTAAAGIPTSIAVSVPAGAAQIRVSVRNAYHHGPIGISEVQLAFHGTRLDSEAVPALGAVGLTASDVSQIPDLIRKIVDQYGHYRATARAFSNSYRAIHQPSAAVRKLLSAVGSASDRSAA